MTDYHISFRSGIANPNANEKNVRSVIENLRADAGFNAMEQRIAFKNVDIVVLGASDTMVGYSSVNNNSGFHEWLGIEPRGYIEVNADRYSVLSDGRHVTFDEVLAHELFHLSTYGDGKSKLVREREAVSFVDGLRERFFKLSKRKDFSNVTQELGDVEFYRSAEAANPECFLAGTPIAMADGSEKPIEEIKPEDWVLSYDGDGNLKPGRVSRTFTNKAKQILDLHGLLVTPGHVTLCGDGVFEGQHVPIIDILRSDGALVMKDGSKVRAATGCLLGSAGDRLIHAIVGESQPDGRVKVVEVGQLRLGTRFINEDEEDISIEEVIYARGGILTEDGYVKTSVEGPKMPFRWMNSSQLPKSEDYILQRSATTLGDIYQADEWEAISPRMPMPTFSKLPDAAISKNPTVIQTASANVPLSMREGVRASQQTISRKQRRAAEARARKAARVRKTTVHCKRPVGWAFDFATKG